MLKYPKDCVDNNYRNKTKGDDAMTINSINNSGITQLAQTNKNENIDKNKVKNEEGKTGNETSKEIVDKFEKTEIEKDPTYKKPVFKRDEETVAKIKAETDKAHENLRNLVKKLLEKQGMTFNDLKIDGLDIDIDDETRAEAQKAIDEGGPYSVESVSDRMVDFAKAISGGDKSKISLLRDAIQKGFDEAEKAFGGKLPEISYKTLERTMEKMDAWVNE